MLEDTFSAESVQRLPNLYQARYSRIEFSDRATRTAADHALNVSLIRPGSPLRISMSAVRSCEILSLSMGSRCLEFMAD
jgi:hypothetical protein